MDIKMPHEGKVLRVAYRRQIGVVGVGNVALDTAYARHIVVVRDHHL